MITLKIKYSTSEANLDLIKKYQRQYAICYKVIYNSLKQGLLKKEIKQKLSSYNNIDLILNNSWFMNCLFYDVKSVLSMDRVCFNRGLILKRVKQLISKEEFKQKKLFKLCSIGEKDKKCNRFFRLESLNTLIFKPNRKTTIKLNLQSIGKNRIKILSKLLKAHELNNELPITYKLDSTYVYLSFDECYLKESTVKLKQDRVFAIDLNPNYVGYSVIDWKDTEELDFRLVSSGVVTLKSLNDKFFSMKNKGISSSDKRKLYLTNKRRFEVYEIAKYLVNLAKHYKCSIFAIEDLSIESSNKNCGKRFNSLCNNLWCRDRLISNIQKRCKITGIHVQKVIANWSSVLGNTLYRNTKQPDMILSSIEISRRAQEFNLQYIRKTKDKAKTIVFPRLTEKVRKLIIQTMEELKICFHFEKLSEYCFILKKNFKDKYRVPLDLSRVFRQRHFKYQVIQFNNC